MANWHSFKALGRFFLFDVPSNSLFAIEEPVYNYLNGDKTAAADLKQIEADLAELKSAGLLNEERETEPPLGREQTLKALCLHISHDCNLRCKYCFAGTGPFGGKREQMSFEIGRAALDMLLAQSGKRRQLEVDFFGGEPLLNWETVQQLVDYGEAAAAPLGKSIHFTLTTNGIALTDEIIDYLNQKQIAIVLSLDGRETVNDIMRGKGVYQQIVPKYQTLINKRNNQNYYLRGTFTRYNLDFCEDAKLLYDLGFREMSLEPVVSPEGDYRLTEADLPRIKEEYERLARFYLEKKNEGSGFTFFHFEVSLEHGPCLPKRLTGCGAGFDYFAVTPTGEIYPCHQFVGRAEYLMGNVSDGIKKVDLREEFGKATLYKKEGCSDCWSRFYCSGGCHANAEAMNGSIYRPDQLGCELQRKRLELALALKAIEMEQQQF